MLRRKGPKIDYISICSPNYLHDTHCRFALRSHADVICEKPLALDPWTIDGLAEIERVVDKHVDELRSLVANRKIQITLEPAAGTWLTGEG
ncbi:hypothetical protein B4Q13_22575, partial [Lacticaseibacillus rhamnosus]